MKHNFDVNDFVRVYKQIETKGAGKKCERVILIYGDILKNLVYSDKRLKNYIDISSKPGNHFYQTSPELNSIKNMRGSGCNVMSLIYMAEEKTGKRLTPQQISELVNIVQSTPNVIKPWEMAVEKDMRVNNPDIVMNKAFGMLGYPNLTATINHGNKKGQKVDYIQKKGKTKLNNPHFTVADSEGNGIYDPWGSPVEVEKIEDRNVYIHDSNEKENIYD